VFSGGEIQTRFDDISIWKPNHLDITVRLMSSDDVMELLMLCDAIKRVWGKVKRTSLRMLYTPYARQDRACAEGEANGIKVFSKLINDLAFDEVFILDPHSDVTTALIDNVVVIKPQIIMGNLGLGRYQHAALVSPDAGANKKVFEVAKTLGFTEVIRADKIRSPVTGQITGTEVYCDDLDGKEVIIVDDICDGGYTFIKLTEKLKEKGAGCINLYVSHGIFSKGLDVLFDSGINRIYTTNSFKRKLSAEEENRLNVFEL
jgi:ribose-phosphate pyrophosphokinase